MTNLQIIQSLTTVWLVEHTDSIADEEKEGAIFLTLTSQGVDNATAEELIGIFRDGSAEDLLREIGVDDDYFVGAMEGFNATFHR